jgi:PAS domain S-box-containing protein
MMKSLLRNAWLPVALVAVFVLLDLTLDRLTSRRLEIDLPHIILVGMALLITFVLVREAMRTRGRAEATRRVAHDELEARVRERTAELARANEALKPELSERERAQEQIKRLASFPRRNPNPVVEIDASGAITYHNTAAAAVIERLGLADARVFFPDDLGAISEALAQQKEVVFEREVPIGDEVFSETVHVIPEFNAVRIYAFEITARKRAEEALRSAELVAEAEKRHLEAVLQALPVGVIITDAQGGVLLTNGMDEQIWGPRPITHSIEDYAQYQAWWADSGKPIEPHEWASAQAVQKGEPVFGQVLEIRRFDGGRGFILNSALPIRDEEGRVTGSAVAIQDITELRRAEQALRASEEKYRLLFQNMAEGFALYELLYDDKGQPADWRILEVNDAYARHTGLAREKIAGRRISELFPPAIPEYLPRFSEVVATQTPSDFETYARAVDRHQHVATFPAGDHRFASIIEDISDRKRAEAALRASEEKFAAVFRVSPVGIVIARADDGRIVDANEAFIRTLGYAPSEVVGARVEDVNLIASIDARDGLVQRFLEQREVLDHELEFRTKDGECATMLVSLAPIQVGDEACILAVTHDITRRKRSEEALRRAGAALALASYDRARIEERQRLARELHDSVSQALYGISLGAHTALTQVDTGQDGVSEALNYVISLAQAGMDEMRAVIFDLRPESLEREGLMVALRKQAVAMRAGHGVTIELNLSDEPAVPLPLKEALYRICREALQNAVKHARADRLEVRLARGPDGIGLEVSDNGVGFDPQAPYPGHLGLHSMRERATEIGGSLDIFSAPGSGTRIRAYVPIPAGETGSQGSD